MAPILKRNFGAHLGMYRAKYVTSNDGHATINLIFGERVGVKHEQVARIKTFRMSPTCIVAILNHNEDAYGAHDCDKIRKLSIGCVTT